MDAGRACAHPPCHTGDTHRRAAPPLLRHTASRHTATSTRATSSAGGHSMGTTPDTEFIRRAVELADLNAVRVALYQHTKDPVIAALPMALAMDDTQRALLVDKAVAWLEEN